MESRGVKDESKRPEVSNKFGVDPKLKEEHKLRVNKELGRRNEQSSWKIEPVCQLKEALYVNNKVFICANDIDSTWKTGCLKAVVRLNSSLL